MEPLEMKIGLPVPHSTWDIELTRTDDVIAMADIVSNNKVGSLIFREVQRVSKY
jgi:hypothetical protein